jgi:hypothetical protein
LPWPTRPAASTPRARSSPSPSASRRRTPRPARIARGRRR